MNNYFTQYLKFVVKLIFAIFGIMALLWIAVAIIVSVLGYSIFD